MRTPKIASLLSVLCLLGSAAAHHHAGCLNVHKFPGLKDLTCQVCYRRKPNAPQSFGCAPLVGDQDKCRFYQYLSYLKQPIVCYQCEAGYAFDDQTSTCIKGTIPGCVSEYKHSDGSRICYGCKNGYSVLSGRSSRCIPSAQVRKPIANCLWGSLYEKGGANSLIYCIRCEAGFSLTYDSKACEKAKHSDCLRNSFDGSRCSTCDVYDGFSQQDDYTCLKVGEDGVLPLKKD